MIYLVTNNSSLVDNNTYKVIGVEESLELLSPLKYVGLDSETQGFNPYLKKLLLLQLGNRDFQIVIDCKTVDIKLYKDYIESTNRTFIGWNLKFDVKFLFYHNIIPRNLYDGYLVEKILWLGYPSGMHSMSLKSAGKNYLNIELDKTIRGEIIWRKELTDEIINYSACDVKYLEDIMTKQMEIINKRGQALAVELENKAILPTAYFEFCGVKLDIGKWKEKMKKDEEELRKAKEELDNFIVDLYNKSGINTSWLEEDYTFSIHRDDGTVEKQTPNGKYEIIGEEVKEEFDNSNIMSWNLPDGLYQGRGYYIKRKIKREFPFIEIAQPDLFGFIKPGPKCCINWNSSKQVIPLLEFFGFNLTVVDKEKGGTKKSVDSSVIEGQRNKHPIAEVYLKFKAAQKVVSTYGQNFLDLINPITGRIHTQFNQVGTDTFRYSSGGGDDKETIPGKKIPLVNLQNLPADAETRACFVAEKDNRWISADYSGEESVILANISKDKAMLDLFRDKGDLHSLVAKMVYPEELKNIDVKDVKKLRPDLRKAAKAPE